MNSAGESRQEPTTNWFAGRVAVVTGGGSGMGRATALALGGLGVKVVVANRRADRGDAVAEEIRRGGGDAVFHRTDVADEGQVRSMVDRAVSEFGGLDLAFNNAGAYEPEGPTGAVDIGRARRIVDVNVLGVLACMRHQIPAMLERGGGAIVNNASALADSVIPNAPAYVASKHAVVGLTRAAAVEYGSRGIRVNAISPGITETELTMENGGPLAGADDAAREAARRMAISHHPIGRLGTPRDMADAVLWLLGPTSSFVLGHALAVDGGWLAR